MNGITNKRTAIFWLLIFASLVLLRVPALIHPVLDVDESIYGLFSRIWFDGGVPYVDCVETKPLGIYFFFGLIFSVFGRFNMIAVHAVTIVVVGATAYVINLIASRLYSKDAGLWAALFYAVFTTTYIPKYIATTIEPVMLLPVVLLYYFWIRFEETQNKKFAVLSGLFFGLSMCFKYQAGMNLIVLLAYLSLRGVRLRRTTKQSSEYRDCFAPLAMTKAVGLFILGSIVFPLIMLLYLWKVGALEGFWLWNIKGNADYIGEGQAAINFGHQILTRVLPYLASTVLLWVLVLVSSPRAAGGDPVLILLWFILTIVPVSAGFRFYGHYFLLLIPPMCILASKVAAEIWSAEGKKWAKGFIIFWIIVPALGFTIARFNMAKVHAAFGEDNIVEYEPLARHIKQNTKPEDKIIAWGYVPLVYWYSERLPATRFFWSDLLTGRIPGTKGKGSATFIMPEAWDMFMSDIKKNRPIYIVDTAPANLHDYRDFPVTRYPRLMEYMNKNYREETRMNGTVFYRRVN